VTFPFILTQYRHWTDRRTNKTDRRQTDRMAKQYRGCACIGMLSRDKN